MSGEFRLSAVGDIALGDHPMCVGFGAFSRFRGEGADFPFRRIAEVLRGSDVVFGNLECTHSPDGLREGSYDSVHMRGEARHLDALAATGFNVLNVANNHSMQHGSQAFLQTLEMLEARGIRVCGVSREDPGIATPEILTVRGVDVGFLGYCLRPRQYFEHAPLYTEGRADGIRSDVARLRKRVPVVVVSLHWGEEFVRRPSSDEVALARSMIDAGASLVIGHHPHVLRGIERYRNGWIAYSLGNFVCDMAWDPSLRRSLILSCRVDASGVREIDLTPVWINDDFQPEPLRGAEGQALLQEVDSLSEALTRVAPGSPDVDYARDAAAANHRIRRRSRRFFLSHVQRYPPRMLLQHLSRFLLNRIHEFRPGG